VKSGDMLAEVETDKATMELESFFDGTLLKIFAPDGSQVEIGAPLCAIGKPGETVEVPETKPPATAPKKEPEEKKAAPEPKEGDEGAKDKTGAATTSKNETRAQPASEPQTASARHAEP